MQLNIDKDAYIAPAQKIGFYQVLSKLQLNGTITEQQLNSLMLNVGLVRLEDGVYQDQSGVLFKMN